MKHQLTNYNCAPCVSYHLGCSLYPTFLVKKKNYVLTAAFQRPINDNFGGDHFKKFKGADIKGQKEDGT